MNDTSNYKLPFFVSECAKIAYHLHFQHTSPGLEAVRVLIEIRQGRRRVADYAVDFRTLAINSDWNNAALVDAF